MSSTRTMSDSTGEGDADVRKGTSASIQQVTTVTLTSPSPSILDGVARALARMGDTAGSAYVAIVGDPSLSTGQIADRYDLEHRSIRRMTAKARELGILTGSSGAYVPVLPVLPHVHDTSATSTTPASNEATVAERLAARAAEAEAAATTLETSRFDSRKNREVAVLEHFGSRLERDVGVCLQSFSVSYRKQVLYSTFLPTDREFTADFVIDGSLVTVIECTASDRPSSKETIAEKAAACAAAGIAFLVVETTKDLIPRLKACRASTPRIAAAPAVAPAPAVTRSDATSYSFGGVHVVRGGVSRDPAAAPAPPPALRIRDPETSESIARYAANQREIEELRAAARLAIDDARAKYRAANPEYAAAEAAFEAHEGAERSATARVAERFAIAEAEAKRRQIHRDIFNAEPPPARAEAPAEAGKAREPEVIYVFDERFALDNG